MLRVTQSVFEKYVGQSSEHESVPGWPGQPSPFLQASLSGMGCPKKGRGGCLVGYQYTGGTQTGEGGGTHVKPRGHGLPRASICLLSKCCSKEERCRNQFMDDWNAAFAKKQKLRRDCFKCPSSLMLYQLLNLQIDVKLVSSLNLEAFVFIHSILSGEQEALCQSHARVCSFLSPS